MPQSDAQYAAIDAESSGDNTLVAAVAGKKIRVLSAVLVATAAVNAFFQSAADGDALSGLMVFAAAGQTLTLPFNPAGWFETAAGELLNLNISGAVSVDGALTYVLVD